MLTLTPDATQAIEQIMDYPGIRDSSGVRISPTPEPSANGSTPSPVELQIVLASEPAGDDQVIEGAGARLFVDDTLSDVLAEMELDAALDGERVQFRLADQA